MKLSIWPSPQQPWTDILEVVGHADRTGWHGAYVWDHFMGDGGEFGADKAPTLESTALISALATATTDIRIGPLVLGNAYRHPAVVANWAATVDRISGGRLVLGLGAGWQRNEHEQYGIPLLPVRHRVTRFEEACTVITGLLDDSVSDFAGRYYRLNDALCEPKPIQRPLPILIGAKGDRMLGVVAEFAHIWNMWSLPASFAERSTQLDRCCEAIGRDPAEIIRTTQALVVLTDDPAEARRAIAASAPRACIAGPASHFADIVAQWRDLGVGEVIVTDKTLGSGQRRIGALDELMDAVAHI